MDTKMEFRIDSTCIILVTVCLANLSAGKENPQIQLHKDLFKNYNKFVRPVRDLSDTVQAFIYLELIQLIDLNEPAQILTAKWYMGMGWKDEYLRWDMAEFENNTLLYTAAENIWLPDMTHTSSYDEKRPVLVMDRKVLAEISYTGDVFWAPMFILKSGCDINVSDFPFDEQICKIRMEQWHYTESEVNYTLWLKSKDLHSVTHSLWDMVKQDCTTETPNPYYPQTHVNCKVHMRRKYKFYMVNMLLPLLVLLAIGSLCFFMRVNEGTRVSLSVTVLLSMTVFLIMIINHLPVSSEGVPHMQKFISASMIILGCSTMASVAIIKVYNHSTGDPGVGSDEKGTIHKPPYILVILYLRILAKICCFKYDAEWENFIKARNKNKASKGGIYDGRKNDAKVEEGSLTPPVERPADNSEVYKRVWIAMAVILNRVCLYAYAICVGCMVIFAMSKAARSHHSVQH